MSITSRPRSSRRGAGFGSALLGSSRRSVCRSTQTLPPNRPAHRSGQYGTVTSRGGCGQRQVALSPWSIIRPAPFLSLAPCPASPPARAPPRPRRSDAESGCSAVMSPRRARTTGSGLIPYFLPMVAATFKPSNAIPSYLLIHLVSREVEYQTNACLVTRIKVGRPYRAHL